MTHRLVENPPLPGKGDDGLDQSLRIRVTNDFDPNDAAFETGISVRAFSDGVVQAARVAMTKGRGTSSAPQPVENLDFIGEVRFSGYYGDTHDDVATGALIQGQASENWTPTNRGMDIVFWTITPATAILEERIRISSDGLLLTGDFTVTGGLTFSSLALNGAISIAGTLDVTGDLTIGGDFLFDDSLVIRGPRPHIDLRAYLPLGFVSGVTDVTTEVQAWLDAAADGTPLLAPQGIYIINAPMIYPITAGAVIEIRGSGSFSRLAESNTGGTIFKAGASFPATGGMFRNSSATAVRSIAFKDIILDGNSKAQYCLDLENCFSFFLDNVTCLRATSHGIYQDGTTYPGPGPVGRRVITYLNGGDGIRISNGIAGAYFTNLFAGANTGKGAHFIGVTECWLTAPELDGNTDEGLRVNNSQKFSIDGGWVGDNGGTTLNQIALVGASIDLSVEGVTVNKTTASNGLTLILLDNVTRVKIRGNTLTFPGAGTNQACVLVGAGSDVTGAAIEGNTFLAATANSVGVSASDNGGAATLTDILVSGNIMRDATTPIYLGGISAANRARFRCTDNAGFNPQAVAGITVGASAFTYTNQDGYPEQVVVSGGTVSIITLRGTTTGLTSGTFVLSPGDALVVTYTVLPTMTKFPL